MQNLKIIQNHVVQQYKVNYYKYHRDHFMYHQICSATTCMKIIIYTAIFSMINTQIELWHNIDFVLANQRSEHFQSRIQYIQNIDVFLVYSPLILFKLVKLSKCFPQQSNKNIVQEFQVNTITLFHSKYLHKMLKSNNAFCKRNKTNTETELTV